MNTENFVVDNGGEGQVVKDVGAVSPHIDRAILSEALVIESIHLSDLSTLVISSDKSNSLWVSDLEGQEEEECLNGVVASIDEISHEEVICVWALATHFEKLLQIVELTMDITTNGDWTLHMLDIGLFLQNFFCSIAQGLHIGLLDVITSL